MPCNAVAMVQAKVGSDTIARLLTGPVIAPVLQQFLQQQYPQWPVVVLSTDATGCRLSLGRIGEYGEIVVERGVVTVRGAKGMPLEVLSSQLTALLAAAGGQLFQQQVRAALAARYGVSAEQRAPNGALVLTLNV